MRKVPSDVGVEQVSERLKGKKIAFAICGGIAATEVVKVIRELRRHGCEIYPLITPAVESFITALSIEWAASKKVVCDLTSEVEHLVEYDAVVIAPLTLNTLSKIALGICDNAVTSLAASFLSSKNPLIAVPTMNEALHLHPLYASYEGRLREWGVQFLTSASEEGRIKMPEPTRIAEFVIEVVNKRR